MKLFGRKVLREFLLCAMGGVCYYNIEIFWRGYSHWAMAIVGGISFLLVGLINEYLEWETPLALQCLIATGYILAVEFVSGCIINLGFGLNVWNYSELKCNLMGQICVQYAIIWYFVSAVAIVFDDFVRWIAFNEKFLKYKIF